MPPSVRQMNCLMNANMDLPQDAALPDFADWKKVVVKYQRPSVPRAVYQMANTLIPYLALWVLMYLLSLIHI